MLWITARRLSDYVTRTDSVALIVIGAAATGMIAVAVSGQQDESTLFWTAVAALTSVGAAAATQWAVVVRRRPALSADLRHADDLMRRLAATQGFTRPTIAFALLMLSQGLTTFGNSVAVSVAGISLLAVALAWYVASRQSQSNLRALINS